MLIDIGVNLMRSAFNEDREEIIKRALKNDVEQIILTGTSLRGSKESSEFAKKHPGTLYSTVGIHPHDAKNFSESCLVEMKKLTDEEHVVAVGECGLDFNRNLSPKEIQEKCFVAQLDLARETNLPLFLHERDAHKRFVDIMKNNSDLIERSVVHCFTGNASEAKEYVSLGFMIGITGWICDERRGRELRQAIKHIPLERLMIETDAPFLMPKNLNPQPKGNRNEPSFLPHIARVIAECMDVTFEEVIDNSTKNAREFFGL